MRHSWEGIEELANRRRWYALLAKETSSITMSYQLLAEGRRYQMSALLELGMSFSEIAKKVKCHRSTVYRELKRNRTQSGYCLKEAHTTSVQNRQMSRKYRGAIERIEFVCLLLESDWSSEQIASILTLLGEPVTHEWIYSYVAVDKRHGSQQHCHLRQGHKRYQKGLKEKATTIKDAISIDERPSIFDSRERFRDWEIDTVLGKHGTGAIVTIIERKSRFYLAKEVESKSAELVTQATT